MAKAFDPYHRWLGIPAEEQPANHYRLLGLVSFEDDPEVIRDAAERQMAHVRGYGLGQHAELSQTILNELAAAKVCLLDPVKKAEYDRRLRQELGPHPAVPPPIVADTGKPPGIPQGPAAPAIEAPMPGDGAWTGISGTAVAAMEVVDAGAFGRARAGAPVWKSPLVIGSAAAGLLLAIVLGVVAFRGGDGEPEGRLRLAMVRSQRAVAGSELAVSLEVMNPDAWKGKLRFWLGDDAPLTAAINQRTGEFTFRPEKPGTYEITVHVASTGQPEQRHETKVVVQVPVKLKPIQDQTAPEGKQLSLFLEVEDPGLFGDELRYALGPGTPEGASIDAKTGEFSWTPTEQQGPGEYPITVRVVPPGSDNLGDQTTFKVGVQEVNQAPVIQPIEDQTVKVGDQLLLSLTATDADQPTNTLTFALAEKPDGADVDWSGSFSFTPTQEQIGDNWVTVRVTDSGPGLLRDQKRFKVAVVGPPPRPSGLSGLLQDASTAMASGDLQKACRFLKAAQDSAGSSIERQEVEHAKEGLRSRSLEIFWRAVGDEFRGLKGLEELTFGGEVVASVVEADGDELWVMWKGSSQPFTVQQLPWELAVALAQRRLPQADPATAVCIASFLAASAPGDPAEAMRRCQQAALAGDELLELLLDKGKAQVPPSPKDAISRGGEPPLTSDDGSQTTIAEGTITLDLENRTQVYTLQLDEQLANDELYVEISGLEAWPVAAEFEENERQTKLNGKLITIKPTQVPAAEIRVKFSRIAGDTQLRIEAYYKLAAVTRPDRLTLNQVQDWNQKLPGRLQEDRAQLARLPQQLQALRGQLANAVAQAGGAKGFQRVQIAGSINRLNAQINGAERQLRRLQNDVPKQEEDVKALPAVTNLVNSLHNSARLRYRLFTKAHEDQ